MASRTAAGDPGIRNTATRPMMPAVARESIAAGPTSANDSMRNSSPNPSSVLSKRARQRLDRGVAAGDPRAPGQQHDLGTFGRVAAIHDGLYSGRHLGRLVPDDRPRHDGVTRGRAQLADQPPTHVRLLGAGVRDGEDGNPDRRPRRCSMFVLARGHGRHYYTVRQTVPGVARSGAAAPDRPACGNETRASGTKQATPSKDHSRCFAALLLSFAMTCSVRLLTTRFSLNRRSEKSSKNSAVQPGNSHTRFPDDRRRVGTHECG